VYRRDYRNLVHVANRVLVDAPKDHKTYSNVMSGSSKLQHRYRGPYTVLWVRDTAVELDMGSNLLIHPVFHVSRTWPNTTDVAWGQEPSPPLHLTQYGNDLEGVHGIVRIKDHAPTGTNKHYLQYLVKWNGSLDSWQTLASMEKGTHEIVKDSHRDNGLAEVDSGASRRQRQLRLKKKQAQY
jgi:hypothetical protein